MDMSRLLTIFLFVASLQNVSAQKNRYMVFFTDKDGSPYTIDEPDAFLSVKAIERRSKHNVGITEADLPVSPPYLQQLADIGADVFFATKWMNGVLVQCTSSLLPEIEQLPFVKAVELVAPGSSLMTSGRIRKSGRSKSKAGATDTQLAMIGVDRMHEDGFKGDGVTIAVLDAGFSGVNVTEPFQHLFNAQKINVSLSKDFVYNSGSVFQYDNHGTEVFSVIAGLVPGSFMGGAPEATFLLYVTEEVPTEYRVEEYNWLFAAEKADSAGADIIHSSLGYHDFDGTEFDYLKSQMDGQTAVVTRAAEFAADRGIVVVVSAGNEGNTSWQTVTPPADGEDVIAVASVDAEAQRANSSSTGPTADNRIKPDVAALGVLTSVINESGELDRARGTSLATPLVTSLIAGILQRYPDLTADEVRFAIRQTASQAANPDRFIGYGIPSYARVVEFLEKTLKGDEFTVYPNPVTGDSVLIRPLYPGSNAQCKVELIGNNGQVLETKEFSFSHEETIYHYNVKALAAGLYFLRIHSGDKTLVYRFVKV